MSAEELEKYENEMELALYREYRDVVRLFSQVRSDGGEVWFDVTMTDAWVWDIYRPARFAKRVRVVTFKDVNVEELAKADFDPLKSGF